MNPVSLQHLGLVREVEEFLFKEAALADANEYEKWFALWSQDLVYWVPCNADDISPAKEVSLIFDDRSRLEERIFRLQTKHAHSQSPKSTLTRTVGNITLENFDATSGGTVHSRFFLAEVRLGRTTVWAGRQVFTLERVNGTFKIRQKNVFLVNNDSVMGNLTFLI